MRSISQLRQQKKRGGRILPRLALPLRQGLTTDILPHPQTRRGGDVSSRPSDRPSRRRSGQSSALPSVGRTDGRTSRQTDVRTDGKTFLFVALICFFIIFHCFHCKTKKIGLSLALFLYFHISEASPLSFLHLSAPSFTIGLHLFSLCVKTFS